MIHLKQRAVLLVMTTPRAGSAWSHRTCRLDVTSLLAVIADLVLGAFAGVVPIDFADRAMVAVTVAMAIIAAVATRGSALRTLCSFVTQLLAVAALDLFLFWAGIAVVPFGLANPAGVALIRGVVF